MLKGGRRLHLPPLTAVIRPNAEPAARLGFAIAARAVPRALDRNRIKRQARESFRVNRSRLAPFDIVILARSGAGQARAAQLRAVLETLWSRLPAHAPSAA